MKGAWLSQAGRELIILANETKPPLRLASSPRFIMQPNPFELLMLFHQGALVRGRFAKGGS